MTRRASTTAQSRQSFFWDFQKNEYFLGYEDFLIFLGGNHKNGLVIGVISLHFRVFS